MSSMCNKPGQRTAAGLALPARDTKLLSRGRRTGQTKYAFQNTHRQIPLGRGKILAECDPCDQVGPIERSSLTLASTGMAQLPGCFATQSPSQRDRAPCGNRRKDGESSSTLGDQVLSASTEQCAKNDGRIGTHADADQRSRARCKWFFRGSCEGRDPVVGERVSGSRWASVGGGCPHQERQFPH